MMKTIRNVFLFSLMVGLFSSWVQAGSYTAASCNYSDVKAVINGPIHTAVSGDTINVPAGSCTWSSGITIPSVAIAIIGAGSSSTIITDALNDGATPLFNATAIPVTAYPLRFSGMTIQPGGSVSNGYSPIGAEGVCSGSTCPNIRVDNNVFTGWSESVNGTASAWMVRVDNFFGVFDHNTVSITSAVLANVGHSAYLGVGNYGDNSYASADSFGTANALYFENNVFNDGAGTEDCDEAPPGGSIGGCRIVVRYNTYNAMGGPIAYFHGTETTGRPRGGRQAEVYGNTVYCTNSSQGCSDGLITLRSGVGLIYSNTLTSSGGAWFDDYIGVYDYRVIAGLGGWGYCDGQGSWDQNDGTTYASGTFTGVTNSSGSLTLTDTTQSWSASQWVNSGNSYSIVDTSVNVTNTGWTGHPGYEITASGTNSVTAANYGQDYWDGPPTFHVGDSYLILRASLCIDQPSRSGGTLLSGYSPSPTGWVSETLDPVYEWNDTLTAGSTKYHENITSGTLKLIANRDYYYQGTSFTGTTGTGTGLLSARPSTCTPRVAYWATDTSTLYQCTATNTWTAYYTPYTYPHPLETSGTGGTGLNPPTTLTLTAQ